MENEEEIKKRRFFEMFMTFCVDAGRVQRSLKMKMVIEVE
jgi:hypothetical protein